ncbi:MAG: thiamine biosynthesis protein ApbE [Flaviaesturariibacter sp.]|nr:thiamine biosynthesis protein ApbE [Flaviaesturariibacter sp.]
MTSSGTLSIARRVVKLMGNRFEFTVVTVERDQAEAAIDAAIAEVQRIEALLTTFNEQSQTAAINRAAGEHPVQVDAEVYALIERSLRISALTQGAFDISYGSLDKRFWNFDSSMTALPDKDTANQMVGLIDYRNIILDKGSRSVFLRKKGMRIGFGGIGKGYAAERAKEILLRLGMEDGVVNAGGDLAAWGHQPDGRPWTIGIAAPDATHHPFSSLNITNKAVATSGNYEKYVLIGGRRYSHTIDPRTGYPVSGIKSATIICPHAELADALATPVTVMGVKAGLHLVNQLPDVACLLIDDNDLLFTSNNIKLT